MNGQDVAIDVSQARAREDMAKRSEENAARAKLDATQAGPAEGPKVVLEIVIRVLEDGNVHVTAPFEDQLAVRGALSCAEDVVRMMGGEIARQRKADAARAVQPVRTPFWRQFLGSRKKR